VINSLGIVPPLVKTIVVDISRDGLLVAIAALGLATSVGDIARSGWRPILIVSATTLTILLAVTAALLAAR
jgi:uncharacterized membrane protein YadS